MSNELLYEGKAKQIYETKDFDVLRVVYKDEATALNGARKEIFSGKGELNNQISGFIFEYLKKSDIKSHFIRKISASEQLIYRAEMIPIEVVVRNIIAGSLAKRLGKKEGEKLEKPIIEFYYKADQLDDPFVNEDHIQYLKLASKKEMDFLKQKSLRINQELIHLFNKCGMILVDFKLEFGRTKEKKIMLADEISPDTCRLWDEKTKEKLDKDVFRKNTGNLVAVYKEVLNRLRGVI